MFCNSPAVRFGKIRRSKKKIKFFWKNLEKINVICLNDRQLEDEGLYIGVLKINCPGGRGCVAGRKKWLNRAEITVTLGKNRNITNIMVF